MLLEQLLVEPEGGAGLVGQDVGVCRLDEIGGLGGFRAQFGGLEVVLGGVLVVALGHLALGLDAVFAREAEFLEGGQVVVGGQDRQDGGGRQGQQQACAGVHEGKKG